MLLIASYIYSSMGIDINNFSTVYVHKVINEENILSSWDQNWSNENLLLKPEIFCQNSDVSKYDF